MNDHFKYPRTIHFPWSLGTSSDDRIMHSVAHFEKMPEVVVTEKLDGENTSMYRDHIHARSLDSRSHPSQNWVRQLHGQIAHEIPEGWRISGENMYAQHSIRYERLSTFFYVISIWNEKNVCLSWDDTKAYSAMLGLEVVPELYRGPWNEKKIKACWTGVSRYADEQEGYVVRNVEAFPYPIADKDNETVVFSELAKYVREKHVRTDTFWRQTWVPNKLESAHE